MAEKRSSSQVSTDRRPRLKDMAKNEKTSALDLLVNMYGKALHQKKMSDVTEGNISV